MQNINCKRCNAIVQCFVNDVASCWCNNYPPILHIEDEQDSACLCKACLHKEAVEVVLKIENSFTAEKALNANWVKELVYNNKPIEGIDYYIENGYFVFKKWFHLKRGYCCGNGCRHCAYND
jgi:hypothetical protein